MIKQKVRDFLKEELHLTLNEEKTKITHLVNNRAKYLGYEIGRRSRKYTMSLVSKIGRKGRTRRATNTRIQIYAPMTDLIQKLVQKGFAWRKDKPKAVAR